METFFHGDLSPCRLISGPPFGCVSKSTVLNYSSGGRGENLYFPLVTRKRPQQQWRELVKLLQSTRPEWVGDRALLRCYKVPGSSPGDLEPMRPCFYWPPLCHAGNFLLSFRASEGCGAVRPAGERGLALGGLSTLPLKLHIHV